MYIYIYILAGDGCVDATVRGWLSRSLSYTHSLSDSLILSHTLALSLSLSLSHTRSLSHSLILTHTLSFSHSLSHTHTLSLALAHATSAADVDIHRGDGSNPQPQSMTKPRFYTGGRCLQKTSISIEELHLYGRHLVPGLPDSVPSHSKVDIFVPRAQHVNLRIVAAPDGGALSRRGRAKRHLPGAGSW